MQLQWAISLNLGCQYALRVIFLEGPSCGGVYSDNPRFNDNMLAYEEKSHSAFFTSFIVWIDQLIWSLDLGSFPFSKPHLILILFPSLDWWGQFLVGGRLFLRQENTGVCSPPLGPTSALIRWTHPLRKTVIYNLGTLNMWKGSREQ